MCASNMLPDYLDVGRQTVSNYLIKMTSRLFKSYSKDTKVKEANTNS